MTDSDKESSRSEEWRKFVYDEDPPVVTKETRQVLEQYSNIPPDEVIDHVTRIREKGFSVYPYPCIGQWRFLDLFLGKHYLYNEILERMRTGNEIFLDLGCAFAQDIRRLVADGVDSSKCYGADLRLEFLDLGYELFKDRATLKANFIEADILKETNALDGLYGKIDIINACSFFHFFTWDECKQVARRCVKLFTGKKNNLLVGRHVGSVDNGEFERTHGRGPAYRHNVESWRKLWTEIGQETGIEFEVDGMMTEPTGPMRLDPRTGKLMQRRRMIFSVRRLND